jgi:hypothetical protein
VRTAVGATEFFVGFDVGIVVGEFYSVGSGWDATTGRNVVTRFDKCVNEPSSAEPISLLDRPQLLQQMNDFS